MDTGKLQGVERAGRLWTRARAGCLLVAALPIACAPSREAAFDVTRAEVEERTGQRARWYHSDPLHREIDDAVDTLLASELTADTAAQVALLNNRALQARFEEIGVARADLVQATLFANPSLSAEVLFPITADEPQAGVGIQLDFLSSVFRPARRALALAQLGVTQLEVAGAAIDVAFEARAALLEYVATRQMKSVVESFVEASLLGYEVAQRLHAAGNIPELALLRERAVYEDARLDAKEQAAELVRARERVNRTLGLVGEETEWKVASALPPLPSDEEVLDRLERRALQRSITLEVGRRRVDVAGRALGITDVQRFLPAFSVGASVEQEDDGLLAGPSLSLALPLLDQGQGQVAAREAELRGLLERYGASAVELQASARQVSRELRLARERAVLLRDVLVPLRTEVLEEAVLQYNAMAIGVFELLQTKRTQLEAQLRLVEATREYWVLRLSSEQLLAGRRPTYDIDRQSNLTFDRERREIDSLGLAGDD